MTQCDAFGLEPAQAAAQVLMVIAVVKTWRTHFASHGVSTSDLDNLAQTLDGEELLSQRQNFDAKQYQVAAAKRKPISPFRRA
jgi:serine/threonine-protein kinase HipA